MVTKSHGYFPLRKIWVKCEIKNEMEFRDAKQFKIIKPGPKIRGKMRKSFWLQTPTDIFHSGKSGLSVKLKIKWSSETQNTA